LQGKQSRVGDGDAMGITREVSQNLFGSSKGRLGVNNPVGLPQLPGQARELGGLRPASRGAVKTELAFSVSILEQGKELAPEEAAQHSDRKKEVLAARDPTRPLGWAPAVRQVVKALFTVC
jgi:hypothetical protein